MVIEYSTDYEIEALKELEGFDMMRCKKASDAVYNFLKLKKELNANQFTYLEIKLQKSSLKSERFAITIDVPHPIHTWRMMKAYLIVHLNKYTEMKEELKALKAKYIYKLYSSRDIGNKKDKTLLKLERSNVIFIDDSLDAKYEPLMRAKTLEASILATKIKINNFDQVKNDIINFRTKAFLYIRNPFHIFIKIGLKEFRSSQISENTLCFLREFTKLIPEKWNSILQVNLKIQGTEIRFPIYQKFPDIPIGFIFDKKEFKKRNQFNKQEYDDNCEKGNGE